VLLLHEGVEIRREPGVALFMDVPTDEGDLRRERLVFGYERRVNPPPKQLWGAVAERLKYAVKPSDMIRDHEWFRELVDQVHKIRGVAVGGILKRYIKEWEKENLLREPGDEALMPVAEQLFFGWKQEVRKYRKITSLNVK